MILQNSGDSLANLGSLTLQDSIVPLITGQVSDMEIMQLGA